MGKIYFTSDLHIGHDKPFLYEPRGFTNIYDHDLAIIKNFNQVITDDDDLYILGDLMLGDNDYARGILNRIPGRKHIFLGNHDTDIRVNEIYPFIRGVDEIEYATIFKYNNYRFYISHYPTMTGNKDKHVSQTLINLFGHTHQDTNFFNDNWYMYHVGLDSHNMMPISIDEIIEEIKDKRSKEN